MWSVSCCIICRQSLGVYKRCWSMFNPQFCAHLLCDVYHCERFFGAGFAVRIRCIAAAFSNATFPGGWWRSQSWEPLSGIAPAWGSNCRQRGGSTGFGILWGPGRSIGVVVPRYAQISYCPHWSGDRFFRLDTPSSASKELEISLPVFRRTGALMNWILI